MEGSRVPIGFMILREHPDEWTLVGMCCRHTLVSGSTRACMDHLYEEDMNNDPSCDVCHHAIVRPKPTLELSRQ